MGAIHGVSAAVVAGMLLIPGVTGLAQSGDTTAAVPVVLDMRSGLRTELSILVRGQRAYIPISSVLGFIHVPYAYDPATSLVSGAYLTPDNTYRIDGQNLSATIGGRVVALTPEDFIETGGEFYLAQELYSPIFDFSLTYNPQRLEVSLKTEQRLPIFLDRERDLARKRRRLLSAVPEPEVEIEREFKPISFGRLGYNLGSTLTQYGPPRRTYGLQLGNYILNGDMDTRLFGTFGQEVTWDNVQSRIRWAWLENTVVRQVYVGDIFSFGIMPSFVFGGEVTNRPAPRRYYFTTDYIDGALEGGGVADLYFNGSLVDYQRREQPGEFVFPAITAYGVSQYEVRSYDQFGLETYTPYRLVVPVQMIPPGEVEYSVSGGVFRQRLDEGYASSYLKWGMNSRLTFGAGAEYYELTSTQVHPYATVTARLTDILYGDFMIAPSAFSRGLLSTTYPSGFAASASYAWYSRNRFYNPRNLNTEATADVTIPIRTNGRRFVVDLGGRLSRLPNGKQRAASIGLSGQVGIFTPRLLHRRFWDEFGSGTRREASTIGSLSINAPGGFLFRATGRYYHTDPEGFRDARFTFGRRFSRGFWLQLFYERDFQINNTFAGLQMTLYFPFALFRATVGASERGGLRSSQSVSGSIGYSPETGDFYTDYLTSRVGFGGIVVQPYVDDNVNNQHDPGEEYITKGRLKTTSLFGNNYVGYEERGFVLDHTLPYEEYYMSLEPQFLDNPLWVPKYASFSVISEPNYFRQVEVPIVVGGVARGAVTYELAGEQRPAEGISITIAPETGERAGFPKTSTTFSTGEFEFLPLPPGRYVISINQAQISQLGYTTPAATRTIEVRTMAEGDQINNIDFTLTR